MERGPRYKEYSDLREKRLRTRGVIEPRIPRKEEPVLTPPKKQVKFQGKSILTQSVPDFDTICAGFFVLFAEGEPKIGINAASTGGEIIDTTGRVQEWEALWKTEVKNACHVNGWFRPVTLHLRRRQRR
ncbi:Uncharacterized protein Fot_51960 [Forsythia ovata]|uniref:Uncharacterized protein n=1 Tax=Forsythia ovata TaxID=205694 RepID=A0ABD1PLX6_9LAMI